MSQVTEFVGDGTCNVQIRPNSQAQSVLQNTSCLHITVGLCDLKPESGEQGAEERVKSRGEK